MKEAWPVPDRAGAALKEPKKQRGMNMQDKQEPGLVGIMATRRQFMGAVGMLALSASLMAQTSTARSEPKQGGSVKFAINDGTQTDSYDPATWQNSYTQVIFGGTLCNALTELDVEGAAVPDLAESFAASDDLKVWTYTLRQGLKFHDGTPVTPNDVIQSYRHHMGPSSSSAVKALVDSIADIKADGDRKVVFTLSGGNADFPYLTADVHLVILPAKPEGGVAWEKGIATGPYLIEDNQPGISVRMKRNPAYHKPGQPYFDAIEFVNIIDVAARTNALLTGEIDYMVDVDIKTLKMLEQNPDVEITRVSGLRHFSFSMNTKTAPFDNPDVRQALKHAIDRNDVINKAFLGNAKVANDNPAAPQIAFAINPEPIHEYDVAKAKEYLAKAGLTTLSVDLSVAETAFPNAIDAALLFKEHAAKAGIEINVIREPDDGYWDNVWQHKPFVGVDWLGKPTLDSLFTTTYATGAPWNDTAWSNKRFDELLVQARAESDKTKRQAMYSEMQELLHSDGGALVIAYALFMDALSKKITHGKIGNMLQCDNFRIAERWWLA